MRGGVVYGTLRDIYRTKTKQTQTYFLIDQKFLIELFVLQSLINCQTPAGLLIDPMLV